MSLKTSNARIIFGLKIKQLRQEGSLSLGDLSDRSGLSVSYLNEIEKGKKYPKTEKIEALAKALGVPMEELLSDELKEGLAPVGDLLKSNFLNELPLDLFGIELSKVIEIIATAPKRVGAFISTLVELSRNYALGEENFYFGALRSYLEMHNNYFEEIEQQVEDFVAAHPEVRNGELPVKALSRLLRKEYGYSIEEKGLDAYPELKDLRSVYLPELKQLLLKGDLTDMQRTFQLGKELGFQYLNLKQRANTSSLLRVNTFEEVLSHFKAGYFSAALMINRETFLEDLRTFFARNTWDPEAFSSLLEKYHCSPEMLFQRMTNLMPQFLGLRKIFFLRVIHTPETGKFKVDKELHLHGRHHPHGNGLFEHYCRRWLSLSLLKDLHQQKNDFLTAIQRSRYHGTKDEYLIFTIARPAYPAPDKNVSVSLGLLIDKNSRKKVAFLSDPAISQREVNTTCERCPIAGCAERAAPPTIIQAKERRQLVERRLKNLNGST